MIFLPLFVQRHRRQAVSEQVRFFSVKADNVTLGWGVLEWVRVGGSGVNVGWGGGPA